MHLYIGRRTEASDAGTSSGYPAGLSSGHSNGPPAINVASKVYLPFVAVYTVLVLMGIAILILAHNTTAMRLRGIGMTIASILMIHVYAASALIAYPLNGEYTCAENYWFMSIVFPLGIGIYQLSNLRLLTVARKQSDLVAGRVHGSKIELPKRLRNVLMRWSLVDTDIRNIGFVALGMLVQLVIALVVFLGSRRFRPTTGFFAQAISVDQCRTGPEWIPSILWQTLFVWVIGPWVLFKSRHIHDTHFWGLQTRIAILAGLPGTPLWLMSMYSKNTFIQERINPWWPSGMWFVPGLIAIQASSFGCAIADMRTNEDWSLRKTFSSDSSRRASRKWPTSTQAITAFGDDRNAFDVFLDRHMGSLFKFASTRDFTGENVEFIRRIRAFKARSIAIDSSNYRDRLEMFTIAALIFFELVEPSTAIVPIDIEYDVLRPLQRIFGHIEYQHPNEDEAGAHESGAGVHGWRGATGTEKNGLRTASAASIGRSSEQSSCVGVEGALPAIPFRFEVVHGSVRPRSDSEFEVPADFGFDIFSDAETAIMYQLFTKTWRKYLKAGDRKVLCIFSADFARAHTPP